MKFLSLSARKGNRMRKLTIFAAALALGLCTSASMVSTSSATVTSSQNSILEHGGGCRKSSPYGQCCHMDNSKGYVHCH